MGAEIKSLESRLAQSKADLKQDWRDLESEIGLRVEQVKDKLSLQKRIVEHPVEAVAVAAVAGLAMGALAGNRRRWDSSFGQLSGPLQQGFGAMKTLAAIAVIEKLAGALSHKIPALSEILGDMSRQISHLGSREGMDASGSEDARPI